MASKRKSTSKKAADLPTFLQELEHRRKDEIEALRAIILAVHEGITERVKWNAPSFCWQGDDRVTFRLHPGDRVQLVFHRGTGVRADRETFRFEDPTGLLEWVAEDRAVVTFTNMEDVKAKGPKLAKLVQLWMSSTE